jgi:hypothetical protein
MKNLFKWLLLVVAFGWAASLGARAEHPHYLHALSDLRFARACITSGEMGPRGHYVVEQIDLAINDIKTASIDDGKPLQDHPPIDANIDFHGRFHRALELLDSAHADVNREEDNDFARGLKHHALKHIDRARDILHEIISSW